jgi:ABC-type transport system involved in multi-copper enzyme maturation permease subunit
VSPWPVAMAIALPYWAVLSKGDPVFWQALEWGVPLGSVLAPAFAGLGVLLSIWCKSNKISIVAGLGLFLLLVLPAELAGPATGSETSIQGHVLQWLNPMAATSRFLRETLVANKPLHDLWFWLAMPVVFAGVVLVALRASATRGVRLEASTGRFRAFWAGLAGGGRDVVRPVQHQPAQPLSVKGPEAPANAHSPRVHAPRVPSRRSPFAPWRIVCVRDLRELWIAGKALILLLLYTIVVGVGSFLSVTNSQLDLIPPKEMVWSLVQTTIYVGVFMGVITGADSLSGARERAALETLLLTPTSRTQIVVGKFLAALSPWPLALGVSVPCMAVLAQGDAIFGASLFWAPLIGTLLVVGFTGLGMLVSFWCNSNKTSLFVSLTLYLLFLLPALLPGPAQKGYVGKFFQRSNPLAAADEFLEKVLVNNRGMHDYGSWLKAPIVFPILVIVLLLIYAGPRLRLEAGRARLIRPHWWSRLARAAA